MIIDEVHLKNFRSHKNTKLNFGRGITVIVGANGAGKTSILDAISFGLFKEKPEGVSVDELITLGKRDGEVSLLFRSNGRRYKVRRKRDRKRGAESFFYHLGEEVESLVAKTEREVTAEVENTLGINGELFTSAVYIKQGEIDRLLSSDPATRKQHIGKLIGTEDMEIAHTNFKEIIRGFEISAGGHSNVQKELDEKKESAKKVFEEISILKGAFSNLEKEAGAKKGEIEQIEKEIHDLEFLLERSREFESLKKELHYIENNIKLIHDYEVQVKETEGKSKLTDEIEDQIEELKNKIASFEIAKERSRRNNDEIQKETSTLISLREELENSLTRASGLLGSKVKTSSQFQRELDTVTSNLKRKLKEEMEKKEGSTKLLGEKNASLESIKKAISELNGAVGSCPVCGRELSESHRAELHSKYSSEEVELSEAKDSLAAEIKRVRGVIQAIDGRISALNSVSVEVVIEKEKRISELEKRVTALKSSLAKDSLAIEKLSPLLEKEKSLKDELLSLQPFRDRYKVARGFLRKNLSEKERLEQKAAEIKAQVSNEAGELEERLKSDSIKIESLPAALRLKKNTRNDLHETLSSLIRKEASQSTSIVEKEKRLNEIREEIAKKEEQAKELVNLQRFKSFLEKIRAIFHKDALQKQLRIKAKPLIEEYARDVFLSFNLPYNDVTLTDDFSLVVHGEGGEESIDMLSGGERIAAALALRIGLSRALSGPVMELIILDEPTIHLDSERRRELVEVIRRLATIPQTIVVTHDKEFEESADRIIEVEKVDGVSVVKNQKGF
jgi:exonuclease SbcC